MNLALVYLPNFGFAYGIIVAYARSGHSNRGGVSAGVFLHIGMRAGVINKYYAGSIRRIYLPRARAYGKARGDGFIGSIVSIA